MKRAQLFCLLFSLLFLLTSCSNFFEAPKENELERPTTTISFYVEDDGHVLMFISNTNLEPVKILINENMVQGQHTVTWIGDNETGDQVAAGVYYYTLVVNGEAHMRTMLQLK